MTTSTETPTTVVDAYFEAVAQNNIEAIEALLTDDFVQHPPPAGSRQGRDAFVHEWRQRIDEDPDRSLVYERAHHLHETVETGSRAGAWVHEWGTYRRTDGSLTFKLNASFRIAGSRISELHAYFDRLDIMTQAGFALTPPQK